MASRSVLTAFALHSLGCVTWVPAITDGTVMHPIFQLLRPIWPPLGECLFHGSGLHVLEVLRVIVVMFAFLLSIVFFKLLSVLDVSAVLLGVSVVVGILR